MRVRSALLAPVLTLALAAPLSGQEVVTAQYDCRAMQTLSDFHSWIEAGLFEKREMWQEGEIFRVEEGTRATLGETQYLYGDDEGPYLARAVYRGNPNGDYVVWFWARCFGIRESGG